MSQVKGTTVGGTSNNFTHLCKEDAEKVIEKLVKKLQKYFENVCLSYLELDSVKSDFASKATGLAKAFRRDTLTKENELKYLNELRNKFTPMINTFIASKVVNLSNIQQNNNTIVTHFKNSSLYKFYDSANWIEKLEEKVKKIYE